MNWTTPPAAESKAGTTDRSTGELSPSQGETAPAITIGKLHIANDCDGRVTYTDLFTMALGGETIRLVPFKNWSQLDVHKWTMRGKLPGIPAGLEVGPDYVNVTGEKVSIHDAEACGKLEKLFTNWIKLEFGTRNLVRTARPKPASAPEPASEPKPLHFHVEVDKRGQVHVHCLQGKQTAATIGLTVAGFESLHHQGLMRKPRVIHVGALHDWVELDGAYFHFKGGRDDSAAFETLLNEHYVPATTLGQGKQIVVLPNQAASTGFDIQFHAMRGGVLDNHRYHLNDESLALLQDAEHCGLLHKRIVVKLNPPNLVFKQKTPDGGEQYLQKLPENIVRVVEEGEADRLIDLSQPLNLLRASAADLTAVFNHPSVNQYGVKEGSNAQSAMSGEGADSNPRTQRSVGNLEGLIFPALSSRGGEGTAAPLAVPAAGTAGNIHMAAPGDRRTPSADRGVAAREDERSPAISRIPAVPARPNLWAKPLLIKPPVRNDWLTSLVYSSMASKFGNSTEGKFGSSTCWSIALCAIEDVDDSAFKGIILTEKGSLGFLNNGHCARFCHGVAFVGTQESALEGIGVTLISVGLDAEERIVFIVGDGFERKFGVPAQTLAHDLSTLKKYGAVVQSVAELLASSDPIAVLWTAPMDQVDKSNPEAIESLRPSAPHNGTGAADPAFQSM